MSKKTNKVRRVLRKTNKTYKKNKRNTFKFDASKIHPASIIIKNKRLYI